MKHINGIAVVLTVAFLLCGCGKKYPDYEQFISDIIVSQDSFLEKMESASTPEEIVSAVNEFGERLTALDERGKKLREKYPESAGWESSPPEGLRDDWDRFHVKWSEFEEKWNLEMRGDKKYEKMLRDPEVKRAFRELGSRMDRVSFL